MSELLYEKKGKTAYITINRPEVLNSLNYAVRKSLLDAWEEINNDPDVWSVIITGGDKVFSSGVDVKELTEYRKHEPVKDLPLDTPETFGCNVKKPVIAAVNGYCLGVAFLTVMNADIRVASPTAKFGLPEAKAAIPPVRGMTVKVAQYFPIGMALETLLLGESISGEDAYRVGFVNKLVPVQDVMPTAESYANKINELSPYAVQSSKQAFYLATSLPPQAVALADAMSMIARHSEDYREGTLAFKEKRKPVWKGR